MSAPVVEPDNVSDSQGLPSARFGQAPGVPYGEWIDPVPAVYTSGWNGGEIDLPDMRVGLDVAEQYAQRILAAVAWQRAQATAARQDRRDSAR